MGHYDDLYEFYKDKPNPLCVPGEGFNFSIKNPKRIKMKKAVKGYLDALTFCDNTVEKDDEFCKRCPFLIDDGKFCVLMYGIFHSKKTTRECIKQRLNKLEGEEK